jgi:hypothetical protein
MASRGGPVPVTPLAVPLRRYIDLWRPFLAGFALWAYVAWGLAATPNDPRIRFAAGYVWLLLFPLPVVVGWYCARFGIKRHRTGPAFWAGIAGAAVATLIAVIRSFVLDGGSAAELLGLTYALGIPAYWIGSEIARWRGRRSEPLPLPTDVDRTRRRQAPMSRLTFARIIVAIGGPGLALVLLSVLMVGTVITTFTQETSYWTFAPGFAIALGYCVLVVQALRGHRLAAGIVAVAAWLVALGSWRWIIDVIGNPYASLWPAGVIAPAVTLYALAATYLAWRRETLSGAATQS